MLSAIMVRALGPAMTYPAYRGYWFDTLASANGFQMLYFGQFWIIHRLTHDPIFLGHVGLASAIPSIVLNGFEIVRSNIGLYKSSFNSILVHNNRVSRSRGVSIFLRRSILSKKVIIWLI